MFIIGLKIIKNMSIKINKISFDENNIINKKDCFITPAKKEDLKRLIIQYNMKVKEQKGNISNNNNEKMILF